jgi:hypothetical protein
MELNPEKSCESCLQFLDDVSRNYFVIISIILLISRQYFTGAHR